MSDSANDREAQSAGLQRVPGPGGHGPLYLMKRVLIALVAALVSLEVLLQLAAVGVWLSRATPEVPRGGAAVVLCTGDSFTFGLRAEDRRKNAYPAAAQDTAIRTNGPTLQFVNVGVPGQDSKRVRERLPAQLDRYRPELVYLLVGYNDSWTDVDPDAIVVDKDPDAFVWEWRTGKLLRVLFGSDYGTAGSEGEATTAPADPKDPLPHDEGVEARLLGPWHQGPQVFVFGSDRTLRTPDGAVDLVYTATNVEGDRGQLLLDGRESGEAFVWNFEFETAVDGSPSLTLQAADGGLQLDLTPGHPTDTAVGRGRQALLDGDLERAEAEFRTDSIRYEARLELAQLLIDTERGGDAVEVLELILDPRAEQSPLEPFDSRAEAKTLELLLSAGADKRVFDWIEKRLTEVPSTIDETFIEFVTRVGLRAPDPLRFDRILASVASQLSIPDPWRIALLGMRIDLGVDDQALIDALVEIGRLRRDEIWRKTIRFRRAQIDPEAFRARAAQLPSPERGPLVADFEDALATEDLTLKVLSQNLRAMVFACRERGAEPVILTYPGGRDELAEAHREIARSLGVDCVDLQQHFKEILRREARSDWFVTDNHCNDRGYREMGRVIALDALTRVAGREGEDR
ncbi:MAG: GDSL-type esterase/lipase family protein [Planctomycetota bacterium]